MLGKALLSASVSAPPAVYVEDVFSTYLYTGNDSTRTLTNGIDLAGKGGLAWIKCRSTANSHVLFTTGVGTVGQYLNTNNTSALQPNNGQMLQAFNANGFQLGSDNFVNASSGAGGGTYASWTFRKAPKFFDVVTYVGDGNSSQTIAHNLGSTPGCIIVKGNTGAGSAGNWNVYHRSTGTAVTRLNLTDTSIAGPYWGTVTSTTFGVQGVTGTNGAGITYIAYIFAHDAGGFGDSGNDNIISCGSYVGSTPGTTVNLGWEPQWVLTKNISSAENWRLHDMMRGMSVNDSTTAGQLLFPSLTNAEGDSRCPRPTPTGFISESNLSSSHTFIYIAIRRGPMKTPTDATTVFSANATGTPTGAWTPGFPVDALLQSSLSSAAPYTALRLTGKQAYLRTSSTAAESTGTDYFTFDGNTNTMSQTLLQGAGSYIRYSFRRAPGFFDVVAYTGTGASIVVNHNLGVTPELIIGKLRGGGAFNWIVYHQFLGTGAYIALNTTAASVPSSLVSAVSATSFTGEPNAMSYSTITHIAYLFATLTGISKVGSYTGTATTLQINCGFTAGARFVMIKRTDSTGDWYVWDTARGIVSGNDPYLLMNLSAAEVTSTDYIDPLNSGFEISSTAPAAINASGGTYIFLAIS